MLTISSGIVPGSAGKSDLLNPLKNFSARTFKPFRSVTLGLFLDLQDNLSGLSSKNLQISTNATSNSDLAPN
jgi:hypothetical protein